MPERTVVTDIDIPFARLVVIFVKLGLAAIPAAMIVGAVFALVMALLGAFFGGTFFVSRWGHV
ncbi:MAG TPA: hypothetical protein PLJ34_03520 [Hyphomicrobiales bacterium]|nr:hypothetical protein [Hyphomicrobiales bacterium]